MTARALAVIVSVVVGCWCVCANAQSTWEQPPIPWNEGLYHIGETVVVEGPVASTRYGGDGTFYINLGNPYPNPDRFSVAIPPECAGGFEARLGEDLNEWFAGETVQVYGTVELGPDRTPYIWNLCDMDHLRKLQGEVYPEQLPDLVIEEVYFSPETPYVGDEVVIESVIQNIGEAPARGVEVVIRVDDGWERWATVEYIEAGGEGIARVIETATEPGEYLITAIVDPENGIEERDEGNNERRRLLVVEEGVEGLPDLAIIEMAFDPRDPLPEEEVTIRALIRNEGNVLAEEILVLFMVDGREVARQTVSHMEPGRQEVVTATWRATTPGDHALFIEIDPEAWIRESNEGNNWVEEAIRVKGVEVERVVEIERVGGKDELGRIIVPVFMYYLARYFSDVPDKTETDMEIKSILDDSPEGREFLGRALENYKAIPEETKYQTFDAKTVQLTLPVTEQLNLDLIRDRLKLVKPVLVGQEGTPAAPSGLVATNISLFEPVKYQIELKWQDNSNNEHGFLIYRAFKGVGGKPQQIASVGTNVTTFVDSLTKPTVIDDQYCYQVVAFRSAKFALAGQQPEQLKSSPSNAACSYYAIGYPPPPPLPDWDGDGIPDKYDKCPKQHAGTAIWTEGCPDMDGDRVPDKDDCCPQVWGEKQDGCPLKYNLRWMSMEVLNNTGAYVYPGYKFVDNKGNTKGLYDNEGKDKFDTSAYGFTYGEEPYLLFAFVNGMTAKGMKEVGTARWCCGEGVDVKKGKYKEPDNDSRGEEYQLNLKDLQDHGLAVFPAVPGKFAEIDRDLGLVLTVTLMERDWTVTITPGKQASKLDAALKSAGAVAGAIGGCVGTGGFGCLVSIGGAMKTIIESLFSILGPGPPPIVIDDPDDYQGTDVWAITRGGAEYKTSNNGAYAFYFDMPTTYYKSCLGWTPCPAGAGVPTTMRARLYFCLYREGTPQSEIKKACSSYEMVLPWPMKSP